MATRHTMKLQSKPFQQIADGTKTIELRLNDAKRQAMRVGDEVIFTKEPDNTESLQTVIVERLEYPTFALLAAGFDYASMGYDAPVTADAARPAYYTEDEERRHGALGLRIKVHGY